MRVYFGTRGEAAYGQNRKTEARGCEAGESEKIPYKRR